MGLVESAVKPVCTAFFFFAGGYELKKENEGAVQRNMALDGDVSFSERKAAVLGHEHHE